MKKIGIYNPYLESKGGGEKVCLALASVLSNQLDTTVYLITHEKIDLNSLGQYFSIDLSKVKLQVIDVKTSGMKILSHLPLPGGIKHLFNDIKIYRNVKKSHFDLFINNCFQSNLPGPSRKNVYMCMFPQKLQYKKTDRGILYSIYSVVLRLIYRLSLHPSKKHAVYSYDLITANSVFTQSYIKKYWGLDSEILYPICDNMRDSKIKEKIILSVGRFFEKGDNHHKRHDFLVTSFGQMTDLHDKGWELHIVGSVAENVDTLKYLLELIDSAANSPVVFHFNAPFKEIKKLYNQAEIYWHATGYGSDPNKFPEKQEHFGISTLEAMSTGAIPVVINTAGQKEVVTDRKNGFLWANEKELMDLTRQVADSNAQELEKIRLAARDLSKDYDDGAFAKRTALIFDKFL